MADQVEITTTIRVTRNNEVFTFRRNKTISFAGGVEIKHYTLAADATQIVWDPTVESTEAAADFDFLALISDGVLDLEKTTNEGDANEVLQTVRLTADLPYMLGADDSYYGATGALGGTLNVIDKLRVDEPASAARTLTVIIGT